jgi:DNA polymerase II small subunit
MAFSSDSEPDGPPRHDEDGVVELFAEENLNATPDAVAEVARRKDPRAVVRRLAAECDAPVVTREDVRDALSDTSPSPDESDEPDPTDTTVDADGTPDKTDASSFSAPEPHRTDPEETPPSGNTSSTSTPSEASTPTRPDNPTNDSYSRERTPSDAQVENDITGESTCTGEYSDFVDYFRDRFDRLSKTLRSRIQPRSIESAASAGKEVALVGMINDVRTTSSDRDNRLVEIEDPTGDIRLLFSEDIVDTAETLVVDEVVGVEGRLSDDGGMVFVNEVHFPDVSPRREHSVASRDVKAVLVSDVHVGSDTFVGDRWDLFADWLRDRPDVEYVLVGGDLVEGVGIYPGQEDELTTVDIHEQYRECAERFAQLPDDVEIITITGNHDSVRLAEPQPALDERFREPFGDNVSFHGNPCTVTVEGVDFLMYHGMSLNPFAEALPGVEIESPETAMVEMLRKRHLAPMYGDVRLAPETRDYLVIDDVPDVLHTGHTHTVGAEKYRNVLTVNTGAWQSQTPYQRSMNIQPDVGYAGVLDLSTLELDLKQFEA